LVLATSLKDLIIYAHFQVNRDYIAKHLCINRDLSELQCYGTCYLNKTIQESKEQEAQFPISDKEERTNTAYVFTNLDVHSDVALSTKKNNFVSPNEDYKHLHFSDTFRPPDFG